MNEQRKNPFIMLKNIIINWPLSVKILSAIFLLAFITAGMIYNHYSSQKEMIYLYEKDISNDIDEITFILSEKGFKQGVEFDIVKNDKISIIVVQRKLAGFIREELNKEGFPRDDRNPDKKSLTDTQEERELLTIRETEQNLSEEIREMEGIKKAKVNIVPQKKALFENDESPAKGTVKITLKDGYTLTATQTASIMTLVSGAVEGLENKNVTVVGNNGEIYSDRVISQGDPNGNIPLEIQSARQKDLQNSLTRNAQTFLDRIVGEGKSKVSVMAEVNFDGVQREITLYGNSCGQDRDNQNKTDSDNMLIIGGRLIGVSDKNGGFKTIGDESNLPPGGAHIISMERLKEKYDTRKNKSWKSDDLNGTGYENLEERFNYALDETKTKIEEAPGKVKRITVALALDNVPEKYINDIKEAVKNSVGFEESRGDKISVVNMPFPETTNLPIYSSVNSELVQKGSFSSLNARLVSITTGLLFIILFIIYIVKQSKSNNEKMNLNMTMSSISSLHNITGLNDRKDGITVNSSEVLNRSFSNWASEKPNEVATLLKNSWLS